MPALAPVLLASTRPRSDTKLLRVQGVCDEHGTKVVHRFVQHRKLTQLMQSTAQAPSLRAKPGEEVATVDPRQVCLHGLVLCMPGLCSWSWQTLLPRCKAGSQRARILSCRTLITSSLQSQPRAAITSPSTVRALALPSLLRSGQS